MGNDVVEAAEKIIDRTVPVLDHGFVMLDSYMGSDAAITRAARNCTSGENAPRSLDDRGLIRHLMRSGHTSPFEFVEFKFLCRMPIFVARQWVRHRTASINEMSGRFGELPELVYVPDLGQVGYQSKANKQGRGEVPSAEVARRFQERIRANAEEAFDDYHTFLGKGDDAYQSVFTTTEQAEVKEAGGISRELARIDLPLNTYTQWAWKIDLHNLLHFLELRLDPHAQWEIREYALAMAAMVRMVCPITWQAFEDYRLFGQHLSRLEVEAIKQILLDVVSEVELPDKANWLKYADTSAMSKAEVRDLVRKLSALGFDGIEAPL